MVTLLRKFIGDPAEKAVGKIRQQVVPEINAWEADMQALSDTQLAGQTARFRERLAAGETLEDLLPEAFATVRETARRPAILGQRHYDVQLIGGVALHRGQIAEMKTGEGKTLVATLPVYLNALPGDGVHIVTVNDYLARRDPVWMGPIYHHLGLTVGCLQHDAAYQYDPEVTDAARGLASLRPVSRRDAYRCDVLYGTNSEFGFDYLRSNMSRTTYERVQSALNYAIVDEVDNILIDEARTPLIISGPAPKRDEDYRKFARFVVNLKNDDDYGIDDRTQAISLTQEGIGKMERLTRVSNLYDPENFHLVHYIENALTAHIQKQRDKDYVVQDGEVVIVDEFTGRLQFGRRWADGLHQAVEAKEGLAIQSENLTYATITLQNYFRMYGKLAGMTGTAITEADEFYKIYGLEVAPIPTNLPMVRDDRPDLVFLNSEAKWQAVVGEIVDTHETGQPILVGTTSVEISNNLSDRLKNRGVPNKVLNASNHAQEAAIIAQAGRRGAVTVSTNMAGRGTDIILGGNPEGRAPAEWQVEHDQVVALGGLHVLGTEHHEARRIDNQLRGRSGRQGDPGSSQFYVALEDELMQRFGGDRIKSVMSWSGMDADTPIENNLIAKSISGAQVKVEGYHFDVRKHLLNFDDVLNTQRDVIYRYRDEILSRDNLREKVVAMLGRSFDSLLREHLPNRPDDDWEQEVVAAFISELSLICPLPPEIADPEQISLWQRQGELAQVLADYAETAYTTRERELGAEQLHQWERQLLLVAIDYHWRNHLTEMESLRTGVGLQAYGQRDPLVVYRTQGYQAFEKLLKTIEENPLVEINDRVVVPFFYLLFYQGAPPLDNGGTGSPGRAAPAAAPASPMQTVVGNGRSGVPAGVKIGRNQPCPCNSGRKYKRCCGANA